MNKINGKKGVATFQDRPDSSGMVAVCRAQMCLPIGKPP